MQEDDQFKAHVPKDSGVEGKRLTETWETHSHTFLDTIGVLMKQGPPTID